MSTTWKVLIFVLCVALIGSMGITYKRLDSSFQFTRVGMLGDNFISLLPKEGEELNKLISQIDELAEDFFDKAKLYSFVNEIVSWTAIIAAIIATFLGAAKLDKKIDTRRVLKVIAIVSAVSASLQLVNDKLGKDIENYKNKSLTLTTEGSKIKRAYLDAIEKGDEKNASMEITNLKELLIKTL
jgi:hypothetical protein